MILLNGKASKLAFHGFRVGKHSGLWGKQLRYSDAWGELLVSKKNVIEMTYLDGTIASDELTLQIIERHLPLLRKDVTQIGGNK